MCTCWSWTVYFVEFEVDVEMEIIMKCCTISTSVVRNYGAGIEDKINLLQSMSGHHRNETCKFAETAVQNTNKWTSPTFRAPNGINESYIGVQYDDLWPDTSMKWNKIK